MPTVEIDTLHLDALVQSNTGVLVDAIAMDLWIRDSVSDMQVDALHLDIWLGDVRYGPPLPIPPEPEVPVTTCINKPGQFLILPDPTLSGLTQISSVTSEDGRYVGPARPRAANEGSMLVSQTGDPTEDVSLEYRVIRSGGLYDEAVWAWKHATDSNTEYRGMDDERRIWGSNTPFLADPPGANAPAAVYSTVYRRICVFDVDDANGDVYIAYKDVDNVNWDDWTRTTCSMPSALPIKYTGTAETAPQIQVVELPDGALRMIAVADGRLFEFDFHVYGSTDGGLTWSIVCQYVIERFTAESDIRVSPRTYLRAAVSGNWIRFYFGDTNDAASGATDVAIKGLISNDRGTSWKFDDTPWAAYSPTAGGLSTAKFLDNTPMDLIGIGDAAGTFLIAMNGMVTNGKIGVAHTSGDSVFAASGIMSGGPETTTPAGSQAYCKFCRTEDQIYLMFFAQGESGKTQNNADGWFLQKAPRDRATDSNAWSTTQANEVPSKSIASFRFTRKLGMGRMQWIQAGPWLLMVGVMAENSNIEARLGALWWRGWSQRTLAQTEETNRGYLWYAQWHSIFGSAGSLESDGNPLSMYRNISSGSASLDWTVQRARLRTTTTAETYYYEHMLVAGTTVESAWNNGCLFAWQGRVGGEVADPAADDIGIRVRTAHQSAGAGGADVTARMSALTVVVYDNHAGAPLATVTGADFTEFHEYRLSFDVVAGVTLGQISIQGLTQSDWSSPVAAGVTFAPSVAALTMQAIWWGNLGQSKASTDQDSYWRELYYRDTDHLSEYAFVNPTTLNGMFMSPFQQYVTKGVQATWGGSGATFGDRFDGETSHSYPAENMFIDSPRVYWLSTSSTQQQLVLDADPDGDTYNRFEHNACGIFNTNDRTLTLEYSNSSTFSTVQLTIASDATTHTLKVDSASGNVVVVSGTPLRRGSLKGSYLRVTTGASAGNTYRITRNVSTRVHCQEAGVDLGGLLSGGETVVVFADRHVVGYGQDVLSRYMRITYPNETVAEGKHRSGTLVVGTTLAIDPPMDWAFNDDERPNTTRYRTRSAVSWAFEEGPPQRTLTGRMIGDLDENRDKFRDILEQTAGYETAPIVLCLNDESLPGSSILGRWENGTKLDNSAWKRNSDNQLQTIGDLSVTFVEEV